MPLINFKTDLTSLKYGMDRPGGGDSGQPFEQFPIDNVSAPDSKRAYYQANRDSQDFPIRGGLITQLLVGGPGGLSNTIDRDRIDKFFNSKPKGTTFIQKQIGLQLTNPRTQVPNTLQFVGLSLNNQVLPVTQTYNPLNTLAQIQVEGTGLHFNRHGVTPTINESLLQTYAYTAGDPSNNTELRNRLMILRALKLVGNTDFLNNNAATDAGIDPSLVDALGISLIQNQLFNYQGGPGSVYGIGTTRIFRTTNSEPQQDPITAQPYSNIAFTYAQIAQQNKPDDPSHPLLQDFRDQLTTQNDPFNNYVYGNLETRIGVGNPGAREDRTSYVDQTGVKAKSAVDSLNALKPFYYDPSDVSPWSGDNWKETKDLVKFAFECVSNDNPAESVALIFRAFFDGQITDNHQGEFNTFKYLGRGETFRVYQGFDRSISFSFKIFTQTRSEMRPLYQKLNHLISQVYPDYSPVTNIMRGSIIKMTLGDYIYRMPGFLENVNVTIDNSTTSWEILLNQIIGIEDDVRQLPHVVSVSCTFRPILDILPRRQTAKNPFVPLIVNNDNDPYVTLGPKKIRKGSIGDLSLDQGSYGPDDTPIAPPPAPVIDPPVLAPSPQTKKVTPPPPDPPVLPKKPMFAGGMGRAAVDSTLHIYAPNGINVKPTSRALGGGTAGGAGATGDW